MSKDAYTEKISLWLDDELNPAEVAELETHLVSCSNCRQLYQAMQQVDDLFRTAAMSLVGPGPGFIQRFETRLIQYRTGRPWQIWLGLGALLVGSFLLFGAWAIAGGIALMTVITSLLEINLFLQWLEQFIVSAMSVRLIFDLGALFLKAGVVLMSQPIFWLSIFIALAMSGLWVRIVRQLSQRTAEVAEFLI